MRFAQTAFPDNHEWVVFLARLRDDVARGAERDFVRGAHHVGLKGKSGRRCGRWRRALPHSGGRRLGVLHLIRIVEHLSTGRLWIECRDFRLERLEAIDVLHVGRDSFVDSRGRFLLEQLLKPRGAVSLPFPS